MRLTDDQRRDLKHLVAASIGPDGDVWLFGSRLDDRARGGDVDLLVRSAHPVPRRLWQAARLSARAERLLGGRKVDVLLLDPDTPLQPIHQIAMRDGQPL